MLITGECTCEKCGTVMEWEYQAYDLNTGVSYARHDFNKHQLDTPRKLHNGEYLFSIECKIYGGVNYFNYKTDLILKV